MVHISNLISRDHALIILGISSLVSLVSGIIVTKISQQKSLEANSYYLKQSFYVNYLVHQLVMSKFQISDIIDDPEFIKEANLLEAEMLVKADIDLLEDIIKLRHEVINSHGASQLTQLQIKTLNKFRKKLHNKPITPKIFEDFVQQRKHLSDIEKNIVKKS